MIEKVKYIKILDRLRLPREDYLLTGGAWLAIMDIRDNGDLDIIASSKLYEIYNDHFNGLNSKWKRRVRNHFDKSQVRARKVASISGFSVEEIVKKHYVEVDGYRFLKFDIFKRYKKSRKRPKDRKDLKSIASFFAKSRHLDPSYKNLF
jgi:hypothetical protein